MIQKTRFKIFEHYKKQVPIDKFSHDANTFVPVNTSDYISYKEFLQYFSEISTINRHNLVIGINFTYGWMPTIFEFCSNRFDEALQILKMPKVVQFQM